MSAYRLSRGVGDLRRVGDLRMEVVLRAAFTIFAIYLLGGGPLSLDVLMHRETERIDATRTPRLIPAARPAQTAPQAAAPARRGLL